MTTDSRAARNWTGVADAYAGTFAHLCAGTIPVLLARAAPRPGEQVLEVGAGTGLLSRELANTGARVTAVEPDPEMLRVALDAAPEEVRLLRGGLPRLPVAGDAFDAVLANFVVNHVGDPRAGVRELVRVTRPGGRILVTIWPGRPTAQGNLFRAVLEEAGATPPEPDVLPPELDFERSVAGLAGLFSDAGAHRTAGEEVETVWRIAPDRYWAGLRAGIGGMGRALLHQEPEVQLRMRAAYDDLSRELVDDGELVLPATAVLVTATKPPSSAQVAARATT